MNRRSWDSASSHWFVSLQCASPQAAAQPNHQSRCCSLPVGKASPPHRGSPLLGVLLPHRPSHPPSPQDMCSVQQWRGGEAGGEGWFLCYCLVLKGRSQLLILRCKEKAPCREVRDRLRNRNYCVFYLRTLKRAFITRLYSRYHACLWGISGGGGECEYVAY